jgi:hypothetical protein
MENNIKLDLKGIVRDGVDSYLRRNTYEDFVRRP